MQQAIMSDASFTPEQAKKLREDRVKQLQKIRHEKQLEYKRKCTAKKTQDHRYLRPMRTFLQTKYPEINKEYEDLYVKLNTEHPDKRALETSPTMMKWVEENEKILTMDGDINQCLDIPKINIPSYTGKDMLFVLGKDGKYKPRKRKTRMGDSVIDLDEYMPATKKNKEKYVRKMDKKQENWQKYWLQNGQVGKAPPLEAEAQTLKDFFWDPAWDTPVKEMLSTIDTDDLMDIDINLEEYLNDDNLFSQLNLD